MGCGTSCATCSSGQVGVAEPYDAKRLLTELVTVQAAIILNEDVVSEVVNPFASSKLNRGLNSSENLTDYDNVGGSAYSSKGNRRQSLECTVTTTASYSLPGHVDTEGVNFERRITTRNCQVSPKNSHFCQTTDSSSTRSDQLANDDFNSRMCSIQETPGRLSNEES